MRVACGIGRDPLRPRVRRVRRRRDRAGSVGRSNELGSDDTGHGRRPTAAGGCTPMSTRWLSCRTAACRSTCCRRRGAGRQTRPVHRGDRQGGARRRSAARARAGPRARCSRRDVARRAAWRPSSSTRSRWRPRCSRTRTLTAPMLRGHGRTRGRRGRDPPGSPCAPVRDQGSAAVGGGLRGQRRSRRVGARSPSAPWRSWAPGSSSGRTTAHRMDNINGSLLPLGYVTGNGFHAPGRSVTADVTMWPRPLVVIANRDALAALPSEQRAVLASAVGAAVPGMVSDFEQDDVESAAVACGVGLTLPDGRPAEHRRIARRGASARRRDRRDRHRSEGVRARRRAPSDHSTAAAARVRPRARRLADRGLESARRHLYRRHDPG